MNNSRTPVYLGFGLLLLGFIILLNSYWELKSGVTINQDKINQLQQQIENQAKPCQTEDLLYPEVSDGCVIPSSTGATDTPAIPTVLGTQGTTTLPGMPVQMTPVANSPNPVTPTPTPAQTPPPDEPEPPPPVDEGLIPDNIPIIGPLL